MKTNEELNRLKEEVRTVNEKLKELSPEELEQVTAGVNGVMPIIFAQSILSVTPMILDNKENTNRP